MQKKGLVNIYHFIRKSTYNDGIFTQEDFDTLKNEMEILKQHQLPATYALKHDAVMDEQYTALIKGMIDENDEVGAWWEITKEMADKAGVKWKGHENDPIDLHVKVGYSLAYLPEERKKLLDVYMEDFKGVYGYYPKSIGSWVMDIVTFTYAREKYGVLAGALCRDQKGIDGFTLWGGYVNGAYYPSRVNEYMPAQSEKMQLDMPIFKLLGPDPIYNLEAEVRREAKGIYTLEPAWTCGQSSTWVSWLFECITEETQVGYGYTQAGQENSFIWGNVGDGFEMQMRQIAELRKQNKIQVESMEASAKWFTKKYQYTPPISYCATKDWNEAHDLKTTWYSSRFYRASFMLEEDSLYIRDLYMFDEAYPSRYLDTAIDNNESVFDALPILDTCEWSSEEKRVSIHIINAETGEKLSGKSIALASDGDKILELIWNLNDGTMLKVVHTESEMLFESEGNAVKWALVLDYLPALKEIVGNQVECEHEGFDYSLKVVEGTLLAEDSGVRIESVEGRCRLNLAQDKMYDSEFFTESYKNHAEAFDRQREEVVRIDEEKLKQVSLVKPVSMYHNLVKGYDEITECVLTNPNDEGEIYYTLDGSMPNQTSSIYTQPIEIQDRCQVNAIIKAEGREDSSIVEVKYFDTLPIKTITSPTKFDGRKVFNRNGALDLIDGCKGTTNYVDNNWLITLDTLDVTVELEEVMQVGTVEIGFMQSKRSGPCYPDLLEAYVSLDGREYTKIESRRVHELSTDPDMEIQDQVIEIEGQAKYIRLVAVPHGKYFIFTDEIIVTKSKK